MKVAAWIYPSFPATNVPQWLETYSPDVISVELFTLNERGLQLITDPVNGFTPGNMAIYRKIPEVYTTLSCKNMDAMRRLYASPGRVITRLVNFCVRNKLAGVDVNFENFRSWTVEDYSGFKNFIRRLGAALHRHGLKLCVVGPTWYFNPRDGNPFVFKYEELVEIREIDTITVMKYDVQFDLGAGTSITPLEWGRYWLDYLVEVVGLEKLCVGLPNYSYTGKEGEWDITLLTMDQVRERGIYEGAVRNEDGELVKRYGDGMVCVINDAKSLEMKVDLVKSFGVDKISLWHGGGGNAGIDKWSL
jgi:spore germination protein YaaH